MITFNSTETIKADDYIHIHVIPSENSQLLNKTYRSCGKGMEETWRACLKDQSKYVIISPKDLLAPINGSQYSYNPKLS